MGIPFKITKSEDLHIWSKWQLYLVRGCKESSESLWKPGVWVIHGSTNWVCHPDMKRGLPVSSPCIVVAKNKNIPQNKEFSDIVKQVSEGVHLRPDGALKFGMHLFKRVSVEDLMEYGHFGVRQE